MLCGSQPYRLHICSLIYCRRTGFRRCRGRKGPFSSHQWDESFAKFSISFASTVCIDNDLILSETPRKRGLLYPMARIVAKFGGTSVADTARIEKAADKVAREVALG